MRANQQYLSLAVFPCHTRPPTSTSLSTCVPQDPAAAAAAPGHHIVRLRQLRLLLLRLLRPPPQEEKEEEEGAQEERQEEEEKEAEAQVLQNQQQLRFRLSFCTSAGLVGSSTRVHHRNGGVAA